MTRAAQVTGHTDHAPLSRYHSGVLTLLERIADAAIGRGVWDDEPPALWCIDRMVPTLGVPLSALTAQEMPLSPQVWENMHGAEVLTLLAERLAPAMRERRGVVEAAGAVPRRSIDGVALCGEGWTLAPPDDATEEQIEQAVLFARARGEADHPWGVEAKTVLAVTTDGWCYRVFRHRPTGEGPAFAEPPDGGITGRYPQALTAFLAAMRAGA